MKAIRMELIMVTGTKDQKMEILMVKTIQVISMVATTEMKMQEAPTEIRMVS